MSDVTGVAVVPPRGSRARPGADSSPRPGRDVAVGAATVCGVLAVSLGVGLVAAQHSTTLVHDRMLPWILSRALGLGDYVALSALVALGIWYRHPWRVWRRVPGPHALLRAHAALAAATVVLLAGHITAVSLDHYAGVGWSGSFVPWHSHYRPTAVALGSLGLYGIVLVSVTAALAGSLARRVWLPIHSVSAVLFGLCLAHGLLAGSDSRVLWWLYAVTGVVVAVLQVTRMVARPIELAETW
jgi:methionine sulfoxide reductase heme-binding subunit